MNLSPDHFLYESDGTYVWTPARVRTGWALTVQKFRELLPSYSAAVLLIGVPGAGKSTWLRANQQPDVLYVDATFTRGIERQPFIEMAQQMGIPIHAVWIHTAFETCVARNSERPEDRAVDRIKMIQMRDNLEADPPTVTEGFSIVTVVRA